MEFYKLYPNKILLSEKIKKMTARQFGAYWLIVCQSMIQTLPGVVDADEQKLMAWARLDKDAWLEDRIAILRPFLFHPGTATLHHEFVKGLFLDQFNLKYKRSAYGKKGAQIRYEGKAKKQSSHPIATPYTPYKPPLYTLENATQENLDFIFSRENKHSSSIPIGTLKTPYSNESINRLMNDSAQEQPAPLGGAGALSEGDGEPLKLSPFLKQAVNAALPKPAPMTDEEFRAKQNATLAALGRAGEQ